jgi:FeS assembly SUF system regulator
MLRVTKLADYGIVIMTNFATHADKAHNARDISGVTRLPLPVVSKVLKSLSKSGLLDSQRGTKGGYRLALPPANITVAAIIHAIEGPIALTECSDLIHGDCSFEFRCPVKTNWNLINRAIFEALERITLAEMTQAMPQPLVNLTIPSRQLEADQAPIVLERKGL